MVGLIVDVMIAPRRGYGRTMWFERRDWSDLRLIFANFFCSTREYPAFGTEAWKGRIKAELGEC
jgi:hypothetical protein